MSATIDAMAVVVRKPALDDVDELVRINIDTWRAAYAGIVSRARIEEMAVDTYRRRWVENVTSSRPDVACFAADVDGRLAAYAIGGPYRLQEDAPPGAVTDLGELYAIYVDPPLQGYGAGTAVHDVLLSWLADQGFTQVALWVLVANEAGRGWYARRGWRADGARAMWDAGGKELPEVRLRRTLAVASAAEFA